MVVWSLYPSLTESRLLQLLLFHVLGGVQPALCLLTNMVTDSAILLLLQCLDEYGYSSFLAALASMSYLLLLIATVQLVSLLLWTVCYCGPTDSQSLSFQTSYPSLSLYQGCTMLIYDWPVPSASYLSFQPRTKPFPASYQG